MCATCPRVSTSALPSRISLSHLSLPRHLCGHPEEGARQGRGHRAARGRRCRGVGRPPPAERPHRLPALGLPGRGLRPYGGARDATRVVGPAQERQQPRGDDRRQDQHEAGGRDARAPQGVRAAGGSSDLLGRRQAWLRVRAEHDLERERVHPLPPARREGRRPESALSDRCHLPASRRLRRGNQGGHGRRRRRHYQARARRDRRCRRELPKSIHIAYPRANYQIEVYDPSPSTGRKLVASGAISPVQCCRAPISLLARIAFCGLSREDDTMRWERPRSLFRRDRGQSLDLASSVKTI